MSKAEKTAFRELVKAAKKEDVVNNINKIPQIKNLKNRKDIFNPWKDIQIEWWYTTGHLAAEDKKEYGFELTFFKHFPVYEKLAAIPLIFLKYNIIIAHFAITDAEKKEFIFSEKSSAYGAKAKISFKKPALQIDNWQFKMDKKRSIHLTADCRKGKNSYEIKLNLDPAKKLVAQGENGYSLKYNKPMQASYYLSYTRLKTNGTITINNKTQKVSGVSWFDHEKTYVPQNPSVTGWDWFSIIFDNNTELMWYDIRTKKGHSKKFSQGTFVDAKSKVTHLNSKFIDIKPTGSWKSPSTKIVYPSGWNFKVNAPKLKMNLKILPVITNQEVNSIKTTIVTYWEGKCTVEGTYNNKKIKGKCYVELAGRDERAILKFARVLLLEG